MLDPAKQHYMSIELDKTAKNGSSSGLSPSSCSGILCGCINYNFNPIVFIGSVVIIWSFVLWCLVDANAATSITHWQLWVVKNFSWLYIGAVFGFVIFMMFLLLHPKYSGMKLGKDDEKPKYSTLSWFAMLWCAGTGGSYFYGVAEPVLHFRDSVEGANRYSYLPRQEQAIAAGSLSLYHSGFGGLSLYCVIGLTCGYLSHRHGFPMTMRTCFYPLIGNKIYGFIGDIIDISAIIATMCGVATSLGLGVIQITFGLQRIFGSSLISNNETSQIIIIWIMTIMATISVVTGIDKGIRILSQVAFGFGWIFLLYLFFAGDMSFLLNYLVEMIGFRIQTFVSMFTQTDSFEQIGLDGPNSNSSAWMASWTVFFWGWWIAWSPFVGLFIANISRGRTVREFILCNILIPTFVKAITVTLMGGSGVLMEYHALENNIGNDCYENPDFDGPISDGQYTRLSCAYIPEQLFILIESYPLPAFISCIVLICIIVYFITSSDSASYVIDLITSNGTIDSPKIQRIFWALTEGAVATALLAIGGDKALTALQTVSIISALPFTFVLIAMVYGLVKALNMDKELAARNRLDIKVDDNYDNCDNYDKLIMENDNNDKNDKSDEIKEWKVDFFDGLFSRLYIGIMSVFAPCILQYKYGKNIGMYGNSCFNGSVWRMFVFIPPILFVTLHILQLFVHGCAYLAWCIYIFFAVIGAYHRIRIREYYHLKGNALIDLLSYCCCYCFAVSQETLQCQPNALITALI